VFVQSLTLSGNNVKTIGGNTEVIVQQLNLVSGSTVGFSSTSSGTLIFQGNLTLNEVSHQNIQNIFFVLKLKLHIDNNIYLCELMMTTEHWT
jgi:hypothetical protein